MGKIPDERNKKKKTSNDGGVANQNERKIITDPRFASLHSDPRFQRAPKHQSKVKIDSRFNRIFTDKKFAPSSAPIDKRGKFKNPDSVNPLLRYYNIDDEEELKKDQEEIEIETEDEEASEEDGEELEPKKKNKKKKGFETESEDEEGSQDIDNEESKKKKKSKKKINKKKKQLETESEDEEGSEDIDNEISKKKKKSKKKINKKKKELETESEDEEGSEEDIDNEDLKKKLDDGSSDADDLSSEPEVDELSLGEPQSESDNDSVTSDSDDKDEVYSDEVSEEPKEQIPEIEKETHRLAVVNMDWNHVRASDLYVIMSSFLPQGGNILSVSVYPSEFGRKRMEEEAVKGPVGLFDSDEEKSDDDDDDEIDVGKLRAYEKSRLRYYFAVVECDSSATADHIYKSCDGMEFERSSNVLDLRFIPDTMQFEHPPRDVATEAPSKYEGLDFHTQALQQSKIHLTWDEDEPQRTKTLRRKLNDDQLAELELKEFLASDDEDSEDADEENDGAADGESDKKINKLDKYRSLVQAGDGSGDDNENDKDMEVTFNTGLEDISKRILEKRNDKKSETVWEAHLRKQKEKKKLRRNTSKDSSEDESSEDDLEPPEQPDDFFLEEPSAKNSKMGKSRRREKQEEEMDKEQEASRAELELLAIDHETEGNLKGYKIKPKKAKGKKGKEVPAEDKLPSVDLNDPRFSALFTSPLFALDPTDAQYKRSAAYARQVAQRQQAQRQQKGVGEESDKGQPKPSNMAPLPSDDTQSKISEQSPSDRQPSKVEKAELSSMIRSMKRKTQEMATNNSNASKKSAPMQSSGLLPKLSSQFLSGKKKARHSKN